MAVWSAVWLMSAWVVAAPQASTADWRRQTEPIRAITATRPLTDADVALLEAAWKNGAWQLREASLRAIGSRLSPVRSVDPRMSRSADLARLGAFRERAHLALDDPQPEVRAAAFEAVTGYYGVEVPGSIGYIVLPDEILQRFARAATADISGPVRRNALAAVVITTMTEPQVPLVKSTIAKAAADASDDVAFIAFQHAARLDVTDALPAIARRLTSPDKGARLNASVAIGRFGPSAKSVLPSLQSALAAETDPTVRATMDAVIRAVGGTGVFSTDLAKLGTGVGR